MKVKEIAKGTFKLALGGYIGYQGFLWAKAFAKAGVVLILRKAKKWSLKLADESGYDEQKKKELEEAFDNVLNWRKEES